MFARVLTISLLAGATSISTACSDGSGSPEIPWGTGGTYGTETGGTTSVNLGGAMAMAGDPIAAETAAAGMGKGFNLGQMFENTQHDRTVAEATAKIDGYYARGYRHVRIPVTWTEDVGGDTLADPVTGVVNPNNARLDVITQVVDYALAQPDLYVIMNAHHEKTLKDEGRSAVLEQLWTDITTLYGDRDPRLIFELLNEPHTEAASNPGMDPALVRQMSGMAYARIRALNPERIIVIGGNRWFAADEMAKVWPTIDEVGGGADPYVMATFHHYNPWEFCGDNKEPYNDEWTDTDISSPMDTMQKWADSVGGMPFFIGEWGVGWQSAYAVMDCNNIRLFYQKMHAEVAGPRGIPTTVWDDGGWFGIWDHAADAFGNNLIDCIDGTCEWNGTERMNAACQ